MGVTRARRIAAAAVVTVTLASAPAPPALPADAPPLGAPVARSGRVVWCASGACLAPRDTAADPGAPAFARGDSLAGWRARAADPAAPALARVALARLLATRGLVAAADSALAPAAVNGSPWAWPALSLRADLALASGDSARAESLLATASPAAWPGADRAAWGLRRAVLAAARGRVNAAEEQARVVVRLFPSLRPSGPALAMLDTLAAARGDSLSLADERAGAESDALRGQRASAASRLRHALPREEPGDRWRTALRLAEVLRAGRQRGAASEAADSALAMAPPGDPKARVRLERARALRDRGRTDDALAEYARAAGEAAGASTRATAWWEYARECEDGSRWSGALAGLRRVADTGGSRAAEARVRAGIVQLARGEPDSARAWWWGSNEEAGRFWLGVTLRGIDRSASDSLLGGLARLPGYGFYRAAARETLGITGWQGELAAAGPPPGDGTPEGSALFAWGLCDEGLQAIARAGAGGRLDAGRWLGAAAVAFRQGRPAQGTRWAERASGLAEDAGEDSLAWAIVPWAYPPAFERRVTAAESLGVERALLWALMRQESRFDPSARSRSDALGLTQLLLPTAGDVARWLREPPPGDSTLFDPDTSVRFGARYLARMLERFGNVPVVALAAYNAGPGTIRPDWRVLIGRGGEALFAEFASNADSQDYVKRITGFRSAYRELRPTSGP